MPTGPNHWDYKMFILAGDDNGICYDFIFYTGKSDKRRHGFGTDIVLDLCETVPRFANYKVYSDNYFTTICFQIELKRLDIFIFSTVRPNRSVDLNIKVQKSYQRKVEVQWTIVSQKLKEWNYA